MMDDLLICSPGAQRPLFDNDEECGRVCAELLGKLPEDERKRLLKLLDGVKHTEGMRNIGDAGMVELVVRATVARFLLVQGIRKTERVLHV